MVNSGRCRANHMRRGRCEGYSFCAISMLAAGWLDGRLACVADVQWLMEMFPLISRACSLYYGHYACILTKYRLYFLDFY